MTPPRPMDVPGQASRQFAFRPRSPGCDTLNTVLNFGDSAPAIPGLDLGSDPTLVVFFETDCPTCQLAIPYLNKLAGQARVIGISQDDDAATNRFRQRLATAFPVQRDHDLTLSRAFHLTFVPSLFLLGPDGGILRSYFGFDKSVINEIAAQMRCAPVAHEFDGAPQSKPSCMSRHLESKVDGECAPALAIGAPRGLPASVVEIPDGEDLSVAVLGLYGETGFTSSSVTRQPKSRVEIELKKEETDLTATKDLDPGPPSQTRGEIR